MDIFLLEDDKAIKLGLEYSLENEGYNVTSAETIKSAYEIINNKTFGFYILDLTLPDGSSYELCSYIKSKYTAPVIFLTAYDDEVNVVMGLELGADDYISKPFRIRELLARMKNILRRCSSCQNENIIKLRNVTINTSEAKVFKNNEEIILTAMEYRLLLILINNKGIVMSRAKLLENIWDIDESFVNDNTLTVYIKRLRDKLEDDPSKPGIIKTIRGMGYIIENE